MADGMVAPETLAGRANRASFMAFAVDAATEAVLRKGLAEILPNGIDIRRGNVRQAIAALARIATPHTLLIDVSGEDQPLVALADLAQVVEPDVRVLVIGDRDDLSFYRHVTRGLGAHEYLSKPLAAETVARHLGTQILRGTNSAAAAADEARGGRMVAVMGARGGVGATTVAANLAWHLAGPGRRHTILLDADLHAGTAAMLLGARTGPGLRVAMESPNRVDDLFVERTALPVTERLHILACEEKLTEKITFAPGAAERLVGILRRRYNYLIGDVGFSTIGPMRELLMQAHQRVIVMTPTLPSIRDTLRLLALPHGPNQARRAVLLLNRATMPGGLTHKQVEDALRVEIDVTINDLPRPLAQAETAGVPAIESSAAFRSGIATLAEQVALVVGETQAPRRRRLLGLLP